MYTVHKLALSKKVKQKNLIKVNCRRGNWHLQCIAATDMRWTWHEANAHHTFFNAVHYTYIWALCISRARWIWLKNYIIFRFYSGVHARTRCFNRIWCTHGRRAKYDVLTTNTKSIKKVFQFDTATAHLILVPLLMYVWVCERFVWRVSVDDDRTVVPNKDRTTTNIQVASTFGEARDEATMCVSFWSIWKAVCLFHFCDVYFLN